MVVSTQETRAVLAADGLASEAGWLRVYHADTVTCEYYGSSEEYLMLGTGIPAHSYADEPPQPVAERQALRRSSDGLCWEQVPDLRGQTAYDTQMRRPQVVSELGPLPANLTLLPPASEFDRWDGVQWVTDTAAHQASQVQAVRQECDMRRQTAHDRIRELTYAQELDIATEQETQALKDWKTYLVRLNRTDPASAPAISWPVPPAS
ncbi:tail fiber assembly protein [Dickeya solani]|uniref:Tail assembly chaperone n=1 Tax=Dickeya solani D s0432-1 TaxID=1231725 RepID=A0AAV3K993_9GAMM|nr:tail fiber assembly protein [Dickeya solani]ANE75277.1 phage tail protein [Dickeya solani IPO 2222]AUC42665.1 Tail fiber assembly protein [Dickeya solani RNS 08.23.3.1.A]AUH09309.1 phage tail protein [Dickeya solani D s0432-1]AUH13284.1 phage tail protein [Dickeya solani]AYQ49817.1 Caudovirales tail fiber assembly protein [Dickeya solani]